MKEEIENAIITSTTLGVEDHGIFTAYIGVEGDGWGGSFGGFALDAYDAPKKKRVGTAYGSDFIKAVLEVVGVGSWEQLNGKHVRVKTTGLGGTITEIGHITKKQWFNPKSIAPAP